MAIKGGKRRRWSEEAKRALLAEAEQPGESVASVARRRGVHANLVYAWRTQLCGARAAKRATPARPASAGFMPLAIAASPAGATTIELETASGARLKIGAADASAVAAIIGALVAAPAMQAL